MKICLILLCVLSLRLSAHAAWERFYLGAYTAPGKGEGIYTGTLDSETGRLGSIRLAARANNPSYLAFSPGAGHLYAVTSDDGGSVAAFGIGKKGALVPINRVTSGGGGPCHLSVDPSGKDILVANYNGGNISCITIDRDGALGARSATVSFAGSGPDPLRQGKPFAHFVATDASGRFAYACDLGTDHVWSYPFDAATGQFGKPGDLQARVPPGSGPRHLAFAPGERFAYVNGEMGRNVTAFRRNKSTGALTPFQTLPLVPGAGPARDITTAEIICHPSGRWLYVSSRGDDIIAVFAIRAHGCLAFVQDVPCLVKTPRGFGIDPTGRWLISAGQDDGRIAVLRISQNTGRLTPAGHEARAPAPVDVLFAPIR